MWRTLRTYVTYGSNYCGISLHEPSDAGLCDIILAKKKGQSLKIISIYNNVPLAQIGNYLKGYEHASLIVNDDQVLIKKVNEGQGTESNLVRRSFPNINLEDFHYEFYKGESTFVALCRKSYITQIMTLIATQGPAVLHGRIGPFALAHLLPIPNTNRFLLPHQTVEAIDTIAEVRKEENGSHLFKIDDEELPGGGLLAFSSVVSTLVVDERSTSSIEKEVELTRKSYGEKRFFKLFSYAALGFLLISLLVNAFFLTHYDRNITVLAEMAELNKDQIVKVQQMKEEVAQKKRLISEMQRTGASKAAFYLDRVLFELPASITLDELEYQPKLQSIKPKDLIKLDLHKIRIGGKTVDTKDFGTWYEQLEKMPWIEKLTILEYANIDQTLTGFVIQIDLKEP